MTCFHKRYEYLFFQNIQYLYRRVTSVRWPDSKLYTLNLPQNTKETTTYKPKQLCKNSRNQLKSCNKQMPNQEKVALQRAGNFTAFLLTLAPPPPQCTEVWLE